MHLRREETEERAETVDPDTAWPAAATAAGVEPEERERMAETAEPEDTADMSGSTTQDRHPS
jgi:hypothetical protein